MWKILRACLSDDFFLGIWKGKSSAECERKCPGGLVSWRMVCI